ncbi:hypothetical protein MIND_01256400 [Mycena indigotica]|uniref:Uncharacterized protein n=1 Tax=Mycena indigotica TaxID=2126181 RepID=A0A8H6S3E6_9AGAR|nr:uncharacterized protein MIND_01256400 [Mycena indigotica]KAF7291132.1 hypothetical protein MIND_01256400 [Mycena indigotica]
MSAQRLMPNNSQSAGGLPTLSANPNQPSKYRLTSPTKAKVWPGKTTGPLKSRRSSHARKRFADETERPGAPVSPSPTPCRFTSPPPVCPAEYNKVSSPTESVFSRSQVVVTSKWKDSESGSPTADRSFDRPASSPEVSPQTLPPLCTEDDSDDEAFVENGEFSEYEEEEEDSYYGDENDSEEACSAVHSESHAKQHPRDQQLENEFWSTRLHDYVATTAQGDYEEPISFPFTFSSPYGAPVFPSPAVVAQRVVGYIPVVLVSVPVIHQGLVHDRPSDEHIFDARFDGYYYDSAGPYDFHRAVLDRSSARDPHSYAQALPATQALVRQLALEYPQIRPDMLTPLVQAPSASLIGTNPYACPFPSCDDHILPTLNAAQAHIHGSHAPARSCPVSGCCEQRGYTAEQLAAHMHREHRVEPARARTCLQCKLCGDQCVGEQRYAAHATRCARGRSPEVTERPSKRARLAA